MAGFAKIGESCQFLTSLSAFSCTMTHDVMIDPVIIVTTGQSYDRIAIEKWLTNHDTCPLSGTTLNGNHQLIPNIALKSSIIEWKKKVDIALKYRKYEVSFDDIAIENLLFRGRSKDIFKGKFLGMSVAVCVFKARRGVGDREADILSTIGKHPNIVRFIARSTDKEGREVLLFELAPSSSNLHDIIATAVEEGANLSERVILTILNQIVDGMKVLHANKIIHKDLTTRNILVFSFDKDIPENILVKISDFDMPTFPEESTNYSSSSDSSQASAPPIRWMAPDESVNKNKWYEKSDVYSFGVLMWEILSGGDTPWSLASSMTDRDVQTKASSGKTLQCQPTWPRGLADIIDHCRRIDPNDRPSFVELKADLMIMLTRMSSQQVTVLYDKEKEMGQYIGATLDGKKHGLGTLQEYSFSLGDSRNDTGNHKRKRTDDDDDGDECNYHPDLPLRREFVGTWVNDLPQGYGVMRDRRLVVSVPSKKGTVYTGEPLVMEGEWEGWKCVSGTITWKGDRREFILKDDKPDGTLCVIGNPYEIFVKKSDGRIITLWVYSSFTTEFLKILLWFSQGIQINMSRLIYAGQQLEDKRTLESHNIRIHSTLHLVLRLLGNIGHFSTHENSPGIEILNAGEDMFEAAKVGPVAIREIALQVLADNLLPPSSLDPYFYFSEDTKVLDSQACFVLKKLLDDNWKQDTLEKKGANDATDFKLTISFAELCNCIGNNTATRLSDIICSDFNKIILRRCLPQGLCISFHLDEFLQVMQVALNSDEEYVGGRLVFATDDGLLHVPRRPAGSYTLHNNSVVHGVSKHETGLRYSLFFIKSLSTTSNQ